MKSTEIRWVLTKEQKMTVINWFKNYNTCFINEDSYPRLDYYLAIPGVTSLGIKIRDLITGADGISKGKVEIKKLLYDFGEIELAQNSFGRINQWMKYSFNTLEDTLINTIIQENIEKKDLWLPLPKDRILLKYDFLSKKICSAKEQIEEGCGIELTRFDFKNCPYFTLGFEAFSSTNNDYEILIGTLNEMFQSIGLVGLKSIDSKSYPEIIG